MDFSPYINHHFKKAARRSEKKIKPSLNTKEKSPLKRYSNSQKTRVKSSDKSINLCIGSPNSSAFTKKENSEGLPIDTTGSFINANEDQSEKASQVSNHVLENFFRSRRDSIETEVKTIFLESQSKTSCMVQTEDLPSPPLVQPVSLLTFIHNSRQNPRIKVNRDIRKSLSIKRYERPENITQSFKVFNHNKTMQVSTAMKFDIDNDLSMTPTRMKVRIQRKSKIQSTCKVLNLANTCTLFTENTHSRPSTAKDLKKYISTVFRFVPASCKSYKPLKLHH